MNRSWSITRCTLFVAQHLEKAAIYEQLAEECAELSKAALKEARILRGDNPTPVSEAEALQNIQEETADVMGCLETLRAVGVAEIESHKLWPLMLEKLERWVRRIEKKEGAQHE